MKKLTKYFFALGLALLISFAGLPKAQAAGTYTLTPWTYDPGNTGTVVSQATENSLHLEKNTDTSTDASAGATIYGVQGLSTTAMTLSLTVMVRIDSQ
jgi:hypothetical protein